MALIGLLAAARGGFRLVAVEARRDGADVACLAATWTRKENKKVGKGVVDAPVVRFGKIDVLWTAEPGARQAREIYGCVRT